MFALWNDPILTAIPENEKITKVSSNLGTQS